MSFSGGISAQSAQKHSKGSSKNLQVSDCVLQWWSMRKYIWKHK